MPELALLGGPSVRTDPFPRWPDFTEKDAQAVAAIIRGSDWSRVGRECILGFEEAFSDYQGAEYCLTLNSGTSALEIALMALELPRGSEVIVSPYTYIASATAILNAGLVPTFVDIDPETYNIDPAAVPDALTDRTSAIMPVHFGGLACDMGAILEIGRAHDLRIVEDAAHGHGARWEDRGLGAIGEFGCFSFQATKNLTAGEGGAILTDDADYYAGAVAYHDLARRAPYARARRGEAQQAPSTRIRDYDTPAGNRRITPLQAALLRSQLSRLEGQTQVRVENARSLTRFLGDIAGIVPRREDAFASRISHHLYIFRFDARAFGGLDRSDFLEALNAEGIPVSGGYKVPLHRTRLFENADGVLNRIWPRPERPEPNGYSRVSCPNAERLCRQETVWIPQYVLLDSPKGMEQIAEAIEKIQANSYELLHRQRD